MNSHSVKITLLTCIVFALLASQAGCQNSIQISHQKELMISANDQRFVLTDGANKIADHPGPGSISLLDFSVFPPKVTHLEGVPCSVIGPPTCAAITPDQKIALVTASMKVNPKNPTEQIPDNQLIVIDLETKPPVVIKTIVVGSQPSGISITRDGQTALIANRADGTVTMLAIRGKSVSIIDTVKVCSPQDSIAHVAIAPNSRFALASLHKANSILLLNIENNMIVPCRKIPAGDGPYCIDFTPDGKLAVAANALGGNVMVYKVDGQNLVKTDTLFASLLSEGLDISPDGRWLVVNCMQDTLRPPTDPRRQQFAQLVLMKRQGDSFGIIDREQIDRIPQAAVFTPDSRYIVVASNEFKRLRIYLVNNGNIKSIGVPINTPGRPCTLRIANR